MDEDDFGMVAPAYGAPPFDDGTRELWLLELPAESVARRKAIVEVRLVGKMFVFESWEKVKNLPLRVCEGNVDVLQDSARRLGALGCSVAVTFPGEAIVATAAEAP